MNRPIIGVVGRPYITNNNRKVLCISESVRRKIIKHGGIPYMILPTQDMVYINNKETPLTDEDKEILDKELDMCDGLLMPGGDFIYFYDIYLAKRANEKDMPILGICMGMQTMCNYNNDNRNIKVENHKYEQDDYVHEVTIDKNSKLYSIVQEETFKVNSLHGYQVPNAGDYTICGYCDGTIIEAVEKKEKKFNIGVQWHPERTDDAPSNKIFEAFIDACKK